MATAKNYRNEGFIQCVALQTEYPLDNAALTTAFGLSAADQVRLFSKDDRNGWNQITIAVGNLTGTWKVEAAVGDLWVELDSGLATDVTIVTHGIGPQVGVHESATPSFRQLPAFRASAYRVTLSAADTDAKIYLIAESFPG